MPRELDWLREQAIRMRRTEWTTDMLADELWLILRGLDPASTGPITIDPADGSDLFHQEPLPDLNIPAIDLDFPEPPQPPDQQVDQDPDTGVITRTTQDYIWSRITVPGLVTAKDSTAGVEYPYSVTIYPNGNLISLRGSKWKFDAQNVPTTKSVSVRVVGDGEVDVDSWNMVFAATEFLVETTITAKDGVELSRTTDARIVQQDHVMIPTTATSTARVAKTFPGGLPGRTGAVPGSGSVILQTINPTTGAYENEVAVNTLNMVTGAVAGNVYIQVKKIEGEWTVDVEDCGDDS